MFSGGESKAPVGRVSIEAAMIMGCMESMSNCEPVKAAYQLVLAFGTKDVERMRRLCGAMSECKVDQREGVELLVKELTKKKKHKSRKLL